MTTYAVIDANYGNAQAMGGASASWLRWELAGLGVEIVAAKDADTVLITYPAAHEAPRIVTALRREGVQPDRRKRVRQRVICGGGVGWAPAILDNVADAICVGEGRAFVRVLARDGFGAACALPNAWLPGEAHPVLPDVDFPWDTPPIRGEDGIVRLFAARGCKGKCLFCQTGWQQRYAETPDPAGLVRAYNTLRAKGERVSVVSNDAAALSFYGQLGMLESFSGTYAELRALMDRGDTLRGHVRQVRIGVEGVSERLRRAVGKPIPLDGLVDVTAWAMGDGVGVRWFMIAGLPGETDDDWLELRETAQQVKRATRKGVCQLSFTAFCPDPAAPLCLAPLDDGYWPRFEAFRRWFFEGDGFSRRVQVFNPAQPAGRLRHAVNSMAATEGQLRDGWEDRDPPNWRVQCAYQAKARPAWQAYRSRVGMATVGSLCPGQRGAA